MGHPSRIDRPFPNPDFRSPARAWGECTINAAGGAADEPLTWLAHEAARQCNPAGEGCTEDRRLTTWMKL